MLHCSSTCCCTGPACCRVQAWHGCIRSEICQPNPNMRQPNPRHVPTHQKLHAHPLHVLCAAAGKPNLGAVQIESVDSPLASSTSDAPALADASPGRVDPDLDPDPSPALGGGEAGGGASSGAGSDGEAATAAAEAIGPATLADVGRAPVRQPVRCRLGSASMACSVPCGDCEPEMLYAVLLGSSAGVQRRTPGLDRSRSRRLVFYCPSPSISFLHAGHDGCHASGCMRVQGGSAQLGAVWHGGHGPAPLGGGPQARHPGRAAGSGRVCRGLCRQVRGAAQAQAVERAFARINRCGTQLEDL